MVRDGNEVNEQVWGKSSWLLMALILECEVTFWVHARLDNYLFVAGLFKEWLSVQCEGLSFIIDGLNTSVVELLESGWNDDLNSWHWWFCWLIDTTKSTSEQTSFNFSALVIANTEERIVSQEVVIKYMVAILLIYITSIAYSIRILNTLPEYFLPVAVINGLPLWIDQHLVSLTDLMKLLKMNFHVLSVFQRVVLQCKFLETK